MRVEHLKRLPILFLSILLVLAWSLPALADSTNKPYFKTYGSDVMTGGWFSQGSNCTTDSTSNYQYPGFSSAALGLTPNPSYGGILAYAKQDASGNSAGGSSSQYGVYSLGSIDGDTSVNGFYGAGAQASAALTAKNLLSFANGGADPWGGTFEGAVRQGHCIPDYYSKKPASVPATASLNAAIATGSNSYEASPAAGTNFSLTNGDVTVPAGAKVTIYVNGSVFIGDNIRYAGATASSVPKFALIAKGSIYISPNVTQLDGFYVAQPSVTTSAAVNTDTGIIWTCHPNDQAQLAYTYPPQCTNRLVINGALAAKQVNFLRVKGDVSGAPATNAANTEDTVTGGLGSSNIAEIINYSPQMIMGGSFFTTSTSTTTGGLPIDSIFSLPPVF
jgi:hypothetical protein